MHKKIAKPVLADSRADGLGGGRTKLQIAILFTVHLLSPATPRLCALNVHGRAAPVVSHSPVPFKTAVLKQYGQRNKLT
jgi:hypothetical protein